MASSKQQQNQKDFLTHLETYLSKRDGVDKILKLTRYTTKLIIATSPNTNKNNPFLSRLKSFESSVGTSRKAFRLGKFVQDINALRATNPSIISPDFLLSVISYGGEGIYYFIEQFVWLTKAGLIDKKNLTMLQKCSAWFELVGYIGSVGLKVRELGRIVEMEKCLVSSIELAELRGEECGEMVERLRDLKEKKGLKRVSVVQDLADAVMAFADVRDGKGVLSGPVILAVAGLVSGVISTRKNWNSC